MFVFKAHLSNQARYILFRNTQFVGPALIALDELRDGNWWLKVRVPRELDRYLVFKGSITIDGISLTIAALENDAAGAIVGVTIIPHTYQHTTLGSAKVGSRLNIEADVLAKHLEKLLSARQ